MAANWDTMQGITLADYNAALAMYTGNEAHAPLTQEQFAALQASPNGLPLPGNLVGSMQPGGLGAFRTADANSYAQKQASKLAGEKTGFGGMLADLQSSPATQFIESAFLGPEIGSLSGLTDAAGTAAFTGANELASAGAGALIGGGTSAATGGNPLTGALKGGALAGIGSGIMNNFGDITSGLGLTGANTAGQSFGQVSGLNDFIGMNAGGPTSPGGAITPSASGGGAIGGPTAGGPAAPTGAFSSPDASNPFSLDTSGIDNIAAQAGQTSPGTTSPSGTFNYDLSGNQIPGPTGSNLGDFGTGAISGGQTGNPLTDVFAGNPSPGTINANNATFDSLPDIGGGAPTVSGGITATSGAKAPSSFSAFADDPSLKNFGSMIAANAAPLIAGAGLGFNALQGNKPVKGENQLNAAASNLTSSGNQLQSYLPSGTLPPGVQASINQAAQSQKAAIKSRFAQQGSSGSSAEQDELAAVDQWAQGQGASTAMQLLNSGISESNMGAALYNDIAKNALTQDQSLASSIAAFASSLAGGGGGKPGQIILNTTNATA